MDANSKTPECSGSPQAQPWRRYIGATLLAFWALLAWEAWGSDLAMAAWFGTAAGFAGQHSWTLETLLHRWPHHIAWLLIFAMAAQLRWPMAGFKRLPRPAIAWGLVAILLALLLIQEIKHYSPSSCPWDLRIFGGHADYLPHWRALLLRLQDGGGGHCFPAGSASSGFAFMAAYPFLRPHAPKMARRWLLAAICAGLVLGWAQQMRGAHFMSHTLWTAWLCWVCGLLLLGLQSASLGLRPYLRAGLKPST